MPGRRFGLTCVCGQPVVWSKSADVNDAARPLPHLQHSSAPGWGEKLAGANCVGASARPQAAACAEMAMVRILLLFSRAGQRPTHVARRFGGRSKNSTIKSSIA